MRKTSCLVSAAAPPSGLGWILPGRMIREPSHRVANTIVTVAKIGISRCLAKGSLGGTLSESSLSLRRPNEDGLHALAFRAFSVSTYPSLPAPSFSILLCLFPPKSPRLPSQRLPGRDSSPIGIAATGKYEIVDRPRCLSVPSSSIMPPA